MFRNDLLESDEQTESSDQGTIGETPPANQPLEDYYHTNPTVSYGRNRGYHSSTSIDPFARSLHTNGHHTYRQRPTFQS